MNYHKIVTADIANGFGWGVVIWLSGCDHHCKGCFNPQTWDKESGIPFDEEAKNKLMNALSKDWISRFTLSGGDPMYQSNRKEVIELCKEIRERFPRMEIWLYTGYKYEEVKADETMSPILDLINVLVDGEFVDELKDLSLPFRGSSNQSLIYVGGN